MKTVKHAVFAALLLCVVAIPALAQRERAQIAEQYKWNLTEIYPTDEAWREAKTKLIAEIPAIAQYKGKLGTSASALADALENYAHGGSDEV